MFWRCEPINFHQPQGVWQTITKVSCFSDKVANPTAPNVTQAIAWWARVIWSLQKGWGEVKDARGTVGELIKRMHLYFAYHHLYTIPLPPPSSFTSGASPQFTGGQAPAHAQLFPNSVPFSQGDYCFSCPSLDLFFSFGTASVCSLLACCHCCSSSFSEMTVSG